MGTDRGEDRARLRALFGSSYPQLWLCAAALTGQPVVADEVVTEAFRRLWRRPRTLRSPGTARPRLFRTVIAGAARRRGVAHDGEVGEPADLDLSLDRRQQLGALPARRRACILLRYVLGLTETQTAEALGCSGTTVRRASRGGAQLGLASLRSPAPAAEAAAESLARLLADLPPGATRPLPLTRLTAMLGTAVVLVLGLGIGAAARGESARSRGRSAAAPLRTPGVRSPAAITDGLSTVTSLVDVGGYLWVAGSYPGGNNALVHVEIATRESSSSLLMDPADGLVTGEGHVAATSDQVFAITGDSGLQTFRGDGTQELTLRGRQLATSPERLAASDATGLWVLSCCSAAPRAHQLTQRRDPATLTAIGDPQDGSPLPGSLLAAGPAGVWLLDGSTGALRRVDKPELAPGEADIEPHPARLPHDLLAVGTEGPVLATSDRLISADADGVTLAATLPAGEHDPHALAVTGTTAYLAFADQIIRYDLARESFGETASYAVPGVTAMTAGSDGVWASTNAGLVRVDRLPSVGPGPRR